jgi:hypothetical protein
MTDVEVPATFILIFLVPEITERYPVLLGNARADEFFLTLSIRRSTPGASGEACVTRILEESTTVTVSSIVSSFLQDENESNKLPINIEAKNVFRMI